MSVNGFISDTKSPVKYPRATGMRTTAPRRVREAIKPAQRKTKVIDEAAAAKEGAKRVNRATDKCLQRSRTISWSLTTRRTSTARIAGAGKAMVLVAAAEDYVCDVFVLSIEKKKR